MMYMHGRMAGVTMCDIHHSQPYNPCRCVHFHVTKLHSGDGDKKIVAILVRETRGLVASAGMLSLCSKLAHAQKRH